MWPVRLLIARAGKLSTADAATLEAHLAGCASCRELARLVEPVDRAVAFADTKASEPLADTHGDATAARQDHDSPEAATNRYRITGEVGRGGIGRVLRARDRVLDRSVALKEVFAASDKRRERFIREALITARLQHPSIVPVHDVGHRDGRFAFYSMKLVAGRPLDKAIAEASTSAQRFALLPIVLAIADAMTYAHSERIIHRDLKPANVLVGRYGETVVIDWGLAKDLAATTVPTWLMAVGAAESPSASGGRKVIRPSELANATTAPESARALPSVQTGRWEVPSRRSRCGRSTTRHESSSLSPSELPVKHVADGSGSESESPSRDDEVLVRSGRRRWQTGDRAGRRGGQRERYAKALEDRAGMTSPYTPKQGHR